MDDEQEHYTNDPLWLEHRHRTRMLEWHQTWQHMVATLNERARLIDKDLAEARANDRWVYIGRRQQKQDDAFMARVQLDAQKFGASQSMSRMLLHDVNHRQIEDMTTDTMMLSITAIVYGHKHERVQTSASEIIETVVPASWWQMFRRDVLRRKKWASVTTEHVATVTASAVPFSAFPEMPYAAPKAWGPRIDMLLPQSPSLRFSPVLPNP